MRGLLNPAIKLMNRMKYIPKFLFIGLLFVLPLAVTVYVLLSDVNREILSAQREREGMEQINLVRRLIEPAQRHRGLLITYQDGEGMFRPELTAAEEEIRSALRALQESDRTWDSGQGTAPRVERILEQWPIIIGSAYTDLPQNNYDRHTVWIADMLELIASIKDAAGLKLDPEEDSYIFIDTLVDKLPSLLETSAQARGTGSAAAARRTVTSDERMQLARLSGVIRTDAQELADHLNRVQHPPYKEELQPYMERSNRTLAIFMDMLDRELIRTSRIVIQPSEAFSTGTAAIDAGYRLYDAELPLLDSMLQDRIKRLQLKKGMVLAIIFAAGAVLLYLVSAFYQSVIRTILLLKRASMRIISGDLNVRVELDTKDELLQVGHAFNKMVDAFSRMLLERSGYRSQIEKLAYYDSLTGLPNRTLLRERFAMAMTHARQNRHMMAVLFLDLDRFKTINDSLGHDTGDQLLQIMSERLTSCTSQGDTVSRMGGDEFVILLSKLNKVEEVLKAGERLLEVIRKPMSVNSHELVVSGSIGISLFPFNGEDMETLVKHADIAMYHAKHRGKNGFSLYDQEMNAMARERLRLEMDLRSALERKEFILHYQPRYDMVYGRITGMEALVRWESPERGLVYPGDFIPLAEETGLIVPLGEWVLRQTLRQAIRWQNEGFTPIRVSVNISAVQFQRDDFVDVIAHALQESGLNPELLELELTESILMRSVAEVIFKLNRLKELGVRIAIDDFGTGFSSLSYLKNFPIDTLKIDRSFIKDIPTGRKDTAITKTIIALGRRLGLHVVAEGVENKEQFLFLASRRCNEAQGYWISWPVQAEEAAHLLSRGLDLTAI